MGGRGGRGGSMVLWGNGVPLGNGSRIGGLRRGGWLSCRLRGRWGLRLGEVVGRGIEGNLGGRVRLGCGRRLGGEF